MQIVVFGLGYVGCVSAACLAELGHSVTGVDVSPDKVGLVAGGQSPVSEPGLEALLARNVAARRLQATTDPADALTAAEVLLVSVGTPSRPNGSLDGSHLEAVARDISAHIDRCHPFPVVTIRSTSMPDAVRRHIIEPIEAATGRRAGVGFGVAVNPEFLREGTAIADFRDPPFTLIGADDDRSAAAAAAVYEGLAAPLIRLRMNEAAMVKYACNLFHALKIGFANEIGTLCHALGVDGHAVMRAFCRDEKLNISTAYLRPGFAFGGSCLPKDLRAALYTARHADLHLPLLASVIPANDAHLQRVVELIAHSGHTRVGLIGLSFKPGTDDLRESPLVRVAEHLIGKGFDLRVYDEDVSLPNLVGANRDFIRQHLPHIAAQTAGTLDDLLAHADLLIVGKRVNGLERALAERPSLPVVDLGVLLETRGRSAAASWVC